MNETVSLELSTELASRARALAAATNRRLEEVVAEWVDRGAAGFDVESSADAELLTICEASLPPPAQDELSRLLAQNRESSLDAGERRRLDELMTSYRQGLLLKARAWHEAVARGLKPPLSDNTA